MAHDQKKIFKKAIEKASDRKLNLFFIEDLCAYVGINKKTFYRYFPVGGPECNDIKELLQENKIRTKTAIKAKWFQSKKGTDNLLLYKLIGTDDERKILSTSYQDIKGEVKNDTLQIVVESGTAEKLKGVLNEIKSDKDI